MLYGLHRVAFSLVSEMSLELISSSYIWSLRQVDSHNWLVLFPRWRTWGVVTLGCTLLKLRNSVFDDCYLLGLFQNSRVVLLALWKLQAWLQPSNLSQYIEVSA